MSKLVNIKIEENATFAKALSFKKDESVASGKHPISGETTYITQKAPVVLTGYTLVAQIKDRFDDPTFVQNIDAQVLDGAKGLAMLGLSKEQTARLAALAPVQATGIGSDRTYKIGYYDVLAVNGNGDATRLFYGECFLTRAVSSDPRITVADTLTKQDSPITPIASPIELSIDASLAKHYLGIRYYKSGIQISPTAGSVEIFKKPVTTNAYETQPSLTFQASVPSEELHATGNVHYFKAIAKNVQGADAYRLVVASNLY